MAGAGLVQGFNALLDQQRQAAGGGVVEEECGEEEGSVDPVGFAMGAIGTLVKVCKNQNH